MDETVFVILLLTGFCVPSASFPDVYHFVKEKMTWNEAQAYCISEHTALAQIHNKENVTTMMNIPTGGYTDKAWIGLYENTTAWTWVDGQTATYFNWRSGEPDNRNASEFCVSMSDDGFWNDCNCSEMKPALCDDGDRDGDDNNKNNGQDSFAQTQMTWTDAKTYCEDQGSSLATVPDKTTNDKTQNRLTVTEVWIGLSRPKIWYWSDIFRKYTFMNWQLGQPDNLEGKERCAAVVLKDGTWTDEQCKVAAYPFFCNGIYNSWKTVVRMKIQSSANMEDPACSADLQRQLRAAFVDQGVTDFKLTWKKLPVKQTQESTDD